MNIRSYSQQVEMDTIEVGAFDNNQVDSSDTKLLLDSTVVYLSFVVNKKGKVKNAKAIRVDCISCDQFTKELFKNKAIQYITTMSGWTPARDLTDNPVKAKFLLPVKFSNRKED